MNFQQLTVFKEVMATGSVSQAAKQLGRTQPAISLTIKNLERDLGLTLFERRGRQLIPVPEAQYLLVEATSILDRMATVSGTMKSLRAAQTGSLNIAAMPGPSAYLFPKFVSENVGHETGFETAIASRNSQQIRELASSQSIDFGFADFEVPSGPEQRYNAEILSTDCYCALHHEDPLAAQTSIAIANLDQRPLGMLQGDHPLKRRLVQAFQSEGVTLTSNISAQYFLPLIPFISLGHCSAIVDPLTMITERELDVSRGKVVFRPFDVPVRYEYAMLTPAYRPASQLAARVKDLWMRNLFEILQDMGAQPRMDAP